MSDKDDDGSGVFDSEDAQERRSSTHIGRCTSGRQVTATPPGRYDDPIDFGRPDEDTVFAEEDDIPAYQSLDSLFVH